MKVKQWRGGAPFCDFCGEWTAGSTFVDGQTKHSVWAIMCDANGCFKAHGMGVGPGVGQRYSTDTKEKLEG